LADGHKVKVTLQFRGREMAHPELGSRILDAVIEQVGSHGKVETMARLEGRNMTMVLAPEKKAVVKKPHEPKAAVNNDSVSHGKAEAPQGAQAEAAQTEVAAPEQAQQAPAEPVAEAVVETADPA
jgi:translation initiation factor IF-3